MWLSSLSLVNRGTYLFIKCANAALMSTRFLRFRITRSKSNKSLCVKLFQCCCPFLSPSSLYSIGESPKVVGVRNNYIYYMAGSSSGQDSQILRCDWLVSGQDGAILPVVRSLGTTKNALLLSWEKTITKCSEKSQHLPKERNSVQPAVKNFCPSRTASCFGLVSSL